MDFSYHEGQPLTVRLNHSDSVIVQVGGSIEESIYITRDNGKLVIRGPMNTNEETNSVGIDGWNIAKEKKLKGLLREALLDLDLQPGRAVSLRADIRKILES